LVYYTKELIEIFSQKPGSPEYVCGVASTKDTTLIGRISDVVRPEREPDFIA